MTVAGFWYVPTAAPEGTFATNEKATEALSLDLGEKVDMKVSRVVLKARAEHVLRVVAHPDHPILG